MSNENNIPVGSVNRKTVQWSGEPFEVNEFNIWIKEQNQDLRDEIADKIKKGKGVNLSVKQFKDAKPTKFDGVVQVGMVTYYKKDI